MRPIGYSTGALALADFRRALDLLGDKPVNAVELSALREIELEPLLKALPALDLGKYEYVSVHAPSCFTRDQEQGVAALLQEHVPPHWPVILHPDTIHDFNLWLSFGDRICIENMDRRKPGGRNVAELDAVFERLPEASFCFDIGHARQWDTTMTEAYMILKRFSGRLRQVHISEVNTQSQHDALSYGAILAFRQVARLIPESVPLILEARVSEDQIEAEIRKAREALPVGEPIPA